MARSSIRAWCLLVLYLSTAKCLWTQTVTNWTGGGDDNWTTAGNWDNGVPNTTNGIAQFNANTTDSPIVNSTTSLGQIVFTSSSDAEIFTGATRTLTLNAVSGVGLDNQGTLTQTFGNRFALGASQTWQSTANGSGLTFDGTVNLSGDALTLALATSGSSTMTFNAAVSGTASSLTVGGNGIALFTAANTYTGATIVDSGATLRMSGAGVLSNSTNVTVNAGGTYDLNGIADTVATIAGAGNISLGAAKLTTAGAGSTEFSGVISGTGGSIDKQGTGNLTLSGPNTFDSGATVNAGTLTVAHNAALGSGTLLLSGGTLAATGDFILANDFTMDANTAIAGAAGIDLVFSSNNVSPGGGTLTLDQNSGTGTLSVGFTGSGFDFDRPIAFADASTELRSSNVSGTQTFSGVISGAGHLLRDGGGGSTTLSGNNTFTGGVTLSAGTLTVGSTTALGAAASTLDLAGGTLTSTASRTLANALTLSASSTIAAADTVAFIFSSSTVGSTGGTLTIDNTSDAGTMAVGFSGSGFDFTGGLNLADAFTELRLLNTSGTQTLSGLISGTGIVRRNTAGGTTILSGANSYSSATIIAAGTLMLGAAGDATNTPLGTTATGTTVSATNAALDLNGFTLGTAEALTLNGTGVSTTGALTNSGAAASYSGIVTLGSASSIGGAGNITLSDGVAGDFALTKVGAGTLALNAASGRTTTTFVNGGTLLLGADAAAGTGAIDLGAGTLSASADRTLTNNLVINNAASAISAANGVDFIFSGTLTGGTGDVLNLVNTSGSGAMTVGFNNSALSYNRGIDVGAFTELHFTNSTGTQTFSGPISGSGSLVRATSGGETLVSGTNTSYSGNVLLSDGTITVGNNSAFGTGTLTLAGGILKGTAAHTLANTFTLTADSTISGDNNTNFIFSSNANGGSAGQLTVANSAGSGVTSVGFSGTGFDFTRNIALNAFTELRFLNTSGTQTFSGDLSGAGLVRQNGAGGTVILAGNNAALSGGVSVDAGTLVVGHASALGTGTLSLGGTLTSTTDRTFANNLNVTLATATIGAADGVDFSFGGTLAGGAGDVLNLVNTSGSGAMSVAFDHDALTYNRGIDLGAFTELRLQNTTGTQAFSGLLTGTGTLVRNTAGGASSFSGNSTGFNGTTVLSDGTLIAGHNVAFGTGTLNLAGGTLGATADRTFANNVSLTGNATIAGPDGNDIIFSSSTITTTGGSLTIDNNSVSPAGVMSVGFSGSGFDFSRPIALADAFTELRFLNTSGTQTFSGDLSGAGLVRQNGAGGTVNLAGNNAALSGGVSVDAGTLVVGHASALGTGTLSLGGTLTSTTDRTFANNLTVTLATSTISAAAGVDFSFSGTLAGGAGDVLNLVNTSGSGAMSVAFDNVALTYSRGVDLGAFTELRLQNTSGTQAFSGLLTGTGTLVRDTAGGTTTISGNSTGFSGTTVLSDGTLIAGHNVAFGTGTLNLAGGTLGATADRTLANNVSLTGNATIAGPDGNDIVFSSNTITTTGGSLTIDNNSVSPAGVMSVGFSGSGFDFSRPIALADAFTELRLLNTSGTQTFSGDISGPGVLRQDGAGGTVLLSGNNSYTGATLVVDGTLQLGAAGNGTDGPLGTVAAGTTVSSGAALDLNGVSLSTAEALTISGTGVGAGGALTNSGAAATYSGIVTLGASASIGTPNDITLAAGLAGNFTLTKVGAGTLTLGAASSRAGGTQVNEGTLRLADAGALGLVGQTLTLNGGAVDLATDSSVAAHPVVVSASSLIVSNKATPASPGITHTLGSLNLNNASTLNITAGANVGSGPAVVAFGATTLGATGAIFNVGAGASLTVASIAGNTRSFTAMGAGDMTVTGAIATTTGTVTKSGPGTLTLAGASSFSGTTTIDGGVLSLQHDSGLGNVSGGTTVSGTGAALELSNVANGNLVTTAEPLFLNGTGVGGNGALRNAAGTNTYSGLVTVSSSALIAANSGTSLTLGAGVSSASQALTLGTTANNGDITIGGNLALGTGSLTKDGSGTLTLSGAANTVGNVSLDAGNTAIGGTSTLTALAVESAAGATLTIATGGLVSATYAADTTTTFSGQFAGGGTFEMNGASDTAVLVLDRSAGFTAASLNLTLNGGTLSLTGGGSFVFGTIHITGDTILDFNHSAGTALSSAILEIDAGVTVTVNNWISVANNASLSTLWYLQSSPGVGGVLDPGGQTLGGTDLVGGTPLDQVHFEIPAFPGQTATWVSGSHNGWFNHEIRPTPEPATYGALLLAAMLGLLAWRRARMAAPRA